MSYTYIYIYVCVFITKTKTTNKDLLVDESTKKLPEENYSKWGTYR